MSGRNKPTMKANARAETTSVAVLGQTSCMADTYLSVKQVAERLGVKPNAIARYKMPEPDAYIGDTRGWKPETIDKWNAARPGRGRWGKRDA